MSIEQASAVPGRARTRVRREPSPSRGRSSRAAIRDTAQPESTHRGTGTKALLAPAASVLLAVALLLVAVLSASGVGPWAKDSSGSRRVASPAAQTIDPRLILTPRTITQAAAADGVQMKLTVGPLLPGANRFALRLTERGRPLTGARVVLMARMIGMAMRPITLPMRAVQPGRYTATGPLPMFGQWQLTLSIDRPGAASLRQQFTLGVDLPRNLLTVPAARGVPRQ